jgi:predicted aspartyl protease
MNYLKRNGCGQGASIARPLRKRPVWRAASGPTATGSSRACLTLFYSLHLAAPRGGHAQVFVQPRSHRVTTAAPIVLPFKLVGGLIVLPQLTFNGQRGDFVLDTGCTYALVVEQAAFPKSQLRISAKRGLSAAGSIPLYEVPITQFTWGVRHDQPAVALATSLAAIRAVVGPRLLGLIGTGLLLPYEVVLDYAHRQLRLYPLDSPSSARPFTRRDSVAFTLEKGWPVAIAFIDSVPVQLLLDTGAQDNSLDADFAQQLRAGTRPTVTRRETLLAPGGRVTAQRAILPVLQVGTRKWRNIPLVLAPPVRYQSGRALPYQGVLGESFWSQEPLVSFHFGRRQFYFLTPTKP